MERKLAVLAFTAAIFVDRYIRTTTFGTVYILVIVTVIVFRIIVIMLVRVVAVVSTTTITVSDSWNVLCD